MFNRTKKQAELALLIVAFTFILAFGGGRSGKTFYFLRAMVIRALTTPSRHLVLRKFFNSVKTAIIFDTMPRVLESLDLVAGRDYRLSKTDWYLKFKNGSEVWFCGVDNPSRLEKVLGKGFSTILIDESTEVNFEAFELMVTRLSEKNKLRKLLMVTCNPTAKKHWIYKTWFETANSKTHASILMNPIDNLENIDENYIENLKTLSQRKQQRFLHGMFVDDIEGALWNIDLIEAARISARSLQELEKEVEITNIVIGVDPAVTTNAKSALTGIVAVAKGIDGNFYVLEDQSIKASPQNWANTVINLYEKYNANSVIVEVNQGGDLVKSLLRNCGFSGYVEEVRASKGKFARAEPVAALYEQGKVFHLKTSNLNHLEDELMGYVPMQSSKSPDRLDAVVWAITHFFNTDDDFFCNVF